MAQNNENMCSLVCHNIKGSGVPLCRYGDMALQIWYCEVISALSLITFTALADGRSSIMHGLSPGPFSIHQDLSVTIRNAAIYYCNRNRGLYYLCYKQERHQKRTSVHARPREECFLELAPHAWLQKKHESSLPKFTHRPAEANFFWT